MSHEVSFHRRYSVNVTSFFSSLSSSAPDTFQGETCAAADLPLPSFAIVDGGN